MRRTLHIIARALLPLLVLSGCGGRERVEDTVQREIEAISGITRKPLCLGIDILKPEEEVVYI